MSQNMLHIISATRADNASAIVGDIAALTRLRDAIDDALASGSGAAATFCSDGEPHAVAIVAEADMYPVVTTYAFEANPSRSKRETVPVEKLVNFPAAMRKAAQRMTTDLAISSI